MIAATSLLLFAVDPAWKAKPTAEWTPDDAKAVLDASPWSRLTVALIAHRQSEEQLREGGQMGQPHGVGYDGLNDKPPLREGLPTHVTDVFVPPSEAERHEDPETLRLQVRWESALPVRLAQLKAGEAELPPPETDGYRIAVYGIPDANLKGDPKQLGAPLKNIAFLRREGKADLKPVSVEVFQSSNGLAAVYLFPLSGEISGRDRFVDFVAQIGRITISQRFNLEAMEFHGRLEL